MKNLNKTTSTKIVTVVMTVVAACSVTGCSLGKTITTTETHTDAAGNIITTTQTTDKFGNVLNGAIQIDGPSVDDVEEETSFGLKDYEGFYCYTGTEEIEDYEVTYTYGYQFNGDGTGVGYLQDVVDFTWNETEIHFGDYTETYTMEPGKLTVGNMVFDKIEGNFIAPNPCYVDTDNVENGIYYAYIDNYGIKDDSEVTISAEIFTEDSYDIVDINRMAKGDVIYINGQLLPITSITQTDSGIIEINGGIENMGSALRAIDESNCYVYVGMDMECSYTRQGIALLSVSEDVKLIDNHDPAKEKEYTGSEAISALKEIVEEYPLTNYDCKITVEEGKIVEINRMYRP